MIATETIVPNRKLKIKFSAKKIEVDPGTKCELGRKVPHIDEIGLYHAKEKISVPCSNKRGPQGSMEGQKEKRQKMDRKASQQCATVLRSLASHPYSWVFSKPVDPVALNIPDYFTIISKPMDLGTIKSKLEKNLYSGIEEFSADVSLTFSNAMTYNPPGNEVHLMAKELNKIFERKWKDLGKKWKIEDEIEKSMSGATARKNNGTNPLEKDILPKKLILPEHICVPKSSSLVARDAKVEVPKSSKIPLKLILKDLRKGSKDGGDGGYQSSSTKACPSSGIDTNKCSICGDVTCHCAIHSDPTHASSNISSEGSEVRDLHARGADADADALRLDCDVKCASPLHRKSDTDSDGTVCAMHGENRCSCPQLSSPATEAASGEAWRTPVLDVQLSPKKALRAAMLKCRFADTILKAKQKTLLDHGDKADPLKMQQEKERLERIQREERAKIEAQIKAAEAASRRMAEEESKKRIEKEREAARIAIQKMERTVEIEHNLEILKELEMLSGCTLSYQALSSICGSVVPGDAFNKPLERLGLFIKDEFMVDDDNEAPNRVWEEGEIFS